MTTISREVEVEFDLADIDTEDLIDELKERKEYSYNIDFEALINRIYELRKQDKNYQTELDDLIYATIGRI